VRTSGRLWELPLHDLCRSCTKRSTGQARTLGGRMPRSSPITKHAWFPGGPGAIPHTMKFMSVGLLTANLYWLGCIGWVIWDQYGPHPPTLGTQNQTTQNTLKDTPRSEEHRNPCVRTSTAHAIKVKATQASCTRLPMAMHPTCPSFIACPTILQICWPGFQVALWPHVPKQPTLAANPEWPKMASG